MSQSGARAAPAGRLWAVAFIALAVLLAVLAAPQFLAALLKLPGDSANIEMMHYASFEIGPLDDIIKSRQAANRWITSGRADNSIGIASIRIVEQLRNLPTRQPEEEKRYLALGISALEKGLAEQPVQPYAWFNLALAYAWRDAPGDVARVEQAWRMSVIVSPNENAMLIARMSMGVFLWDTASPATREMIAAEVARAVRNQPRWAGERARAMGAQFFMFRLLSDKPDLLALFAEMLRLPEAGSPLFP